MNSFQKILPLITLLICYMFSTTPSLADIYGVLDEEGYLKFDSSNHKKYDNLIEEISQESGIESTLIKAIIKVESNFNYSAVSSKGAQGLMQLMPDIVLAMKIDDPFSAKENIKAGTQYLRQLLDLFKENKTLALAAYNAGPEIVKAYNGVPPFPETRTYIQKVLQYYKEYSAGD